MIYKVEMTKKEFEEIEEENNNNIAEIYDLKRDLEKRIKERNKYKKINDIVVDFMKERKINSEETISQNDKIIEYSYELLNKLFQITKDQFLCKCENCGAQDFREKMLQCEECQDYYCEDCESQLVRGICDWCLDEV